MLTLKYKPFSYGLNKIWNRIIIIIIIITIIIVVVVDITITIIISSSILFKYFIH